jgi:hypothetical protein
LQVENDKVSNLANCEGWLTKVVQMPQISPVKIFWIGSPSEKMFEDLPEHVPRYLQIYEITETNKVIISTEGRMWPLGEENIFRPGEYSFSVVVRADGAKAVNCHLKLKWTGDWRTAEMAAMTTLSPSSLTVGLS